MIAGCGNSDVMDTVSPYIVRVGKTGFSDAASVLPRAFYEPIITLADELYALIIRFIDALSILTEVEDTSR